jgi:hypothetical protein
MKDASYKWKSTQPTSHGTWRMKFIFVFLIPTFLILISTQMVPYVPSEGATMLPIILLIFYPIFAGIASLHNTREVLRARSNPASAFLSIDPPLSISSRGTITFNVRSNKYAAIFQQLNPTLLIMHDPRLGGETTDFQKKMAKKRLIMPTIPTLIAVSLIAILAVATLPVAGPGTEFTSIQDINDGLITIGTQVTVRGTVSADWTYGFAITENGATLFIFWNQIQPSMGLEVTVVGEVQSTSTLNNVVSVDW